jgi:hypothetical protein
MRLSSLRLMAARRFTVCLPAGRAPAPPPQCAGCGAPAQGSLRINDLTSAFPFGPAPRGWSFRRSGPTRFERLFYTRITWDCPACADCRRWHRRRERVRTACTVALVAAAASAPWWFATQQTSGVLASCLVAALLGAVFGVTLVAVVVECVWPPLVSLSPIRDLVAYTFVDERCARAFAAKNGVELSTD